MDEIIQPTVVLLILSLITEKIANFIKLQNDTMAHRTNVCEDEKLREKKIQQLSIIVGIVVALAAKANLFDFFSKDFKLYWHEADFEFFKLVSNIIGCIISGLFLSLGSKFFHDLLDILLQIKNLKRKLNDKAHWNFNAINDIDNYIKEDETNRIENALQLYKDKFKKIENVVSVITSFRNDIPTLNVYVNDKFDIDILLPKKIFYLGINNVPKEAIVKVIKGFEPVTHGSEIKPADAICNLFDLNISGAMGGRVFDELTNEEYFLSCFHVIKTPNHSWNSKKPNKNKNVVNKSLNNDNCGLIITTIRDHEVDVAVMKPINGFEVSASIKGLGIPCYSRIVTSSDKKNNLKVMMHGMVSGYREGIIFDNNTEITLKYADGTKNQFTKLITVEASSHNTFSISGDSGSFVLDQNNYLVGMVVGGFENYSYIMPIETILRKTGTKLIKE